MQQLNNDTPGIHITILILLIFTALNLLILDIKVFSPSNDVRISDISISIVPSPLPTTHYPQLTTNSCPASCISLINQSSQATIGSPIQPTTDNRQLTTVSREYIIPLGSGSTDKSDWQNMIATETFIDPANYGTIKSAQLIVGLRNPTNNGSVEARLYNVTDGYVVWGSQVSMQGKTEQSITAGPFEFPKGPKLYRMQLRSTLQFLAYLDNARLKIMVN